MVRPLKMVGLFAGIGGIELGFRRALGSRVQTELLCEWWEPAQDVLRARFPGVELHPDVRELRDLPRGLDLLSAGFPCTDLSQAGRTAGITGNGTGVYVSNVFEALRLTAASGSPPLPWLMIENVRNMLVLDHGRAIAVPHRRVEYRSAIGGPTGSLTRVSPEYRSVAARDLVAAHKLIRARSCSRTRDA